VHSHPLRKRVAAIYYARQILYLAKFCRGKNVRTVFSHMQHANIIAVHAQFLTRSRVIAFRHHDRTSMERNRMEQQFDRVINRLARTIVVLSTAVYDGMDSGERVDMSRVVVLPSVYDFAQYPAPEPDAVMSIRQRHPAQLRLLMNSRLVPIKRHVLAFSVVRDLVAEGLDVHMLVLDDGPERASLEDWITEHRLQERITLLGFREDAINYMAASDVLVHPSLTEASNNAVKEMALLGKTAIVCQGVGDFDDYVEPGRSGFVVPRATTGGEIAEALRVLYAKPGLGEEMGARLRDAVLERFAVRPESIDRYLALLDGVAASSSSR
jgi:glycosyltransferase involved in cell wall biosynthesis